ncbi:MAG: ABC transporter permease [Burkholderiaceae bacterium]
MGEKQWGSETQRGDMAQRRTVPYRGGGFQPKSVFWVAPLVFVLVLLLWELGSQTGWISAIVLPAPSEAIAALADLVTSGEIWRHLGASLSRLLQGWLYGTLLGLLIGIAAGLFSLARAGIVPVVAALFPIPKIALLPLFIIWFGIGEESKVATIFFGTLFPTVISVVGGIDNVDRGLIRMGQSFGLSWFSIVRKIILPGAMPTVLSGFRISASIAIILLVAAEMIGAEYGIGAYILLAGNLMATDQLLAGVALLSTLGLCVSWLLNRAERWVLKWR